MLETATAAGLIPFEGHHTWYKVVGDLELAKRDDGPAPLVAVHGGPGATHDYLLSLSDLAVGGRAVIFYDQTGNGNSTHFPDRGADFYTVDLFVRELANLIEQLGIGHRYHVLGQSWGGLLAQEHAVVQPPGLRALVLSNTAASFPSFALAANSLLCDLPEEVQRTLQRHEDAGTVDDPEYAEACKVFYDRHLCRLDPWPVEVQRAFELLDADPTVYRTTNGPSEFRVVGSFKNLSVLDRLHRITVPVLVISGRYDEAAPEVQSELMAALPDAEQVILENSSHMPFWEEREAYMRHVDAFLRRHD